MEPGSELDGGKYRIVRLLGQGGMGAVYEAENTRSHKRVAIKCLHPALQVASPEATERLVREAEASGRVRHPNVVDIYDVGRDGETVFLVMEYLDGESLTVALARGGLAMHRVVALLLPAMRAVAAAHKQGVVHRDIKPDNIFLARETDAALPVPKVLDFGISKLEARGGKQFPLTRAGAAIGTPMYMSYEQLMGVESIDGRADVYAFGVVLYEALTGHVPYTVDNYNELAVEFEQAPLPPKQLRGEIPLALDRIVMWAIARERDERIPSMDALIRELEPFATEHSFRGEMTMGSALLDVRARASPQPSAAPHRTPRAESHADTIAELRASVPPVVPQQRTPRIAVAVVLVLLLTAITVALSHSLRAPAAVPALRHVSVQPKLSEERVVPLTPVIVPRDQPAQLDPPTCAVTKAEGRIPDGLSGLPAVETGEPAALPKSRSNALVRPMRQVRAPKDRGIY